MDKPVLIVGDCCIDVFVYCSCSRLCPEGPVPVLDIIEVKKNHGMAGNVERNFKALNQQCELICNSNYEKITKTRYVEKESNHLFIRIDEAKPVKRINNLNEINYLKYSAIVISDYDKGFLLQEDIEFISNRHPLTFMDTKKILGDWAKNISFIKINKKEYEASKSSITDSIKDNIITTLGSEGCMFKNNVYPTIKSEVKDVSGAGDTFLASLATKYLKNKNIIDSINFANKCASLVVQKRGVSTI
jgi:D-beta-D-heptose 7-phosphate kinase/D-beta-D-heptose 1-phosphate adenosyltransferase